MIEIEIVGWEKYNARSDRANYSWLRFQNDFFQNQKLFGITDAQTVLYLMLLCEASKKNGPVVEINLDYIATIRKTPVQKIDKDIQELVERGVVVVTRGHQTVSSLPATNERTRRTNETNVASVGTDAADENQPVKFYCDEYKARYNHSPVIGPKQAGILTRFAKSHPRKWPELIRGYLQLPDMFLVQRSHPTELLESKLNEIERFLKTGKVVTRKVATDLEKKIDKAQGTGRRRSLAEIEADAQKQQFIAIDGGKDAGKP